MLTIWKDLLDLIFPHRPECPFCGEPSPKGDPCGRCLAAIEGYHRERPCSRCGRLAEKGAQLLHNGAGHLCYDCRKRDWPFTLARAGGPYEGILKEAIHSFKYAGRRSLAAHLADLMVEVCRSEPRYQSAGLIVPVPLSREKLRLRGFNQAGLLAVEVGRALGLPVNGGCLVKDFDTPPQVGLKRAAREANLKGAFSVSRPDVICDQVVLIIDDV
ncbi:MAG: double zinc ribbon domain-containing protein, partial [Desulfotomaculaceae bacterium]|nr:double zinc ribbon domain-containing protein [Desulfotomaculaceae bacterium]